MQEAALKPLPQTEEFLQRLARSQEPAGPPADTALFGATFAEQPSHASGTERNHAYAIKAALEFRELCRKKGCDFPNWDDWMVALAKWTLDPQFLLDGEDNIKSAVAQREKFAILAPSASSRSRRAA